MKRTLILSIAVMFMTSSLAFATKSMLIDFSKLAADFSTDGSEEMTENERTLMDYSVTAGTSYREDDRKLMKTSLALANWEVSLNSSARNVNALALSQVKEAVVRDTDEVPENLRNKPVMGVRVVFPTWNANANARITPPYEILAYEPLSDIDGDGNRQEPTDEQKDKFLFEDGYGLVKNVGTIKQIAVTTLGMNFPHGLYVLLKDNDNIERRYFMGYLNFDYWKTLIWKNPQYLTEVRNREIRLYPIYPRGTPFVKFCGFQITRDAADAGDNFIGYFKDVQIIYDLAVRTADRDIDDENLWGIISKKEKDRQNGEMNNFGVKQVNRYLEKTKMAAEDEEFNSETFKDAEEQQ